MRMSQITIQEIRDKTTNGESLNKISEELGIGKTTVYYYFRKIKGKTIKPISLNFNSLDEMGEILGIFAGDGHFQLDKNYTYTIRIYLGFDEMEYANDLVGLFSKCFGKKPMMRREHSVIILTYTSKDIYKFLKEYLQWGSNKTYSIRLKNLNHDKNFLLGFIRGLIDTDGGVYKPKHRVQYGTISLLLARQVSEILDGLNLKYNFYPCIDKRGGNRHTMYHIHLHGENARNLLKLIKPRNPKRYLD